MEALPDILRDLYRYYHGQDFIENPAAAWDNAPRRAILRVLKSCGRKHRRPRDG
jgi:hypothetical protein